MEGGEEAKGKRERGGEDKGRRWGR